MEAPYLESHSRDKKIAPNIKELPIGLTTGCCCRDRTTDCLNDDTEQVGADEDPWVETGAQDRILDALVYDYPLESDRDSGRDKGRCENEHDELNDERAIVPDGSDRGHGYTGSVSHELEHNPDREKGGEGPCSTPYTNDGGVDENNCIERGEKDAGPKIEEVSICRSLDRTQCVNLIAVIETWPVVCVDRHCRYGVV